MPNLQEYKARLRFIRPYVKGFGAGDGYDMRQAHKWSSARKAQITRYYEGIRNLTARSHYIYRPRTKKNLDAVKRAIGAESLKKLKVGIIQVPTEFTVEGVKKIIKPKIKIRKDGSMHVKIRNIGRDTLLFEDFGITAEDLALDPASALETILEQIDYRYYTVMAGEFEVGRGIPQMFLEHELIERVTQLVNRYSANNYEAKDHNSSYYGNWMHGLIGYNFEKIREVADYQTALGNYNRKKKKINRKIKNAKVYIEKLEKEVKLIKRSRILTPKQKENKLKVKARQIYKQKQRVNMLIIERLKQ